MSGIDNDGATGGRSVLAQRTVMKGEFDAPGAIEVAGHFEGRIKADTVVIEATGTMTGQIDAARVTIRGQYTGEITAEELRVLSGATLGGTVKTKRLLVEVGAIVDFACRMA